VIKAIAKKEQLPAELVKQIEQERRAAARLAILELTAS